MIFSSSNSSSNNSILEPDRYQRDLDSGGAPSYNYAGASDVTDVYTDKVATSANHSNPDLSIPNNNLASNFDGPMTMNQTNSRTNSSTAAKSKSRSKQFGKRVDNINNSLISTGLTSLSKRRNSVSKSVLEQAKDEVSKFGGRLGDKISGGLFSVALGLRDAIGQNKLTQKIDNNTPNPPKSPNLRPELGGVRTQTLFTNNQQKMRQLAHNLDTPTNFEQSKTLFSQSKVANGVANGQHSNQQGQFQIADISSQNGLQNRDLSQDFSVDYGVISRGKTTYITNLTKYDPERTKQEIFDLRTLTKMQMRQKRVVIGDEIDDSQKPLLELGQKTSTLLENNPNPNYNSTDSTNLDFSTISTISGNFADSAKTENHTSKSLSQPISNSPTNIYPEPQGVSQGIIEIKKPPTYPKSQQLLQQLVIGKSLETLESKAFYANQKDSSTTKTPNLDVGFQTQNSDKQDAGTTIIEGNETDNTSNSAKTKLIESQNSKLNLLPQTNSFTDPFDLSALQELEPELPLLSNHTLNNDSLQKPKQAQTPSLVTAFRPKSNLVSNILNQTSKYTGFLSKISPSLSKNSGSLLLVGLIIAFAFGTGIYNNRTAQQPVKPMVAGVSEDSRQNIDLQTSENSTSNSNQNSDQNSSQFATSFSLWLLDNNLDKTTSPEEDIDQDGLNNYEEYILTTNPASANTCNPDKTDTQNLELLINPATCQPIDLQNPAEVELFSKVINISLIKEQFLYNDQTFEQNLESSTNSSSNSSNSSANNSTSNLEDIKLLFGVKEYKDIDSIKTTDLKSKIAEYENQVEYLSLINKVYNYMKQSRSYEAFDRNYALPVHPAVFVDVSQKYNVPLKFVLAVARKESRFGTDRFVSDGNPTRIGRFKNIYAIGLTDGGDNLGFESWEAGVEAFGKWYQRQENLGRSDCQKWKIYNPNGDYCATITEISNGVDSYLKK